MIAESKIGDLAIRSQSDIVFASGGNTERFRINSDGSATFGGSVTVPSFKVANTFASLILEETDQTGANGLWRFEGSGNTFSLARNTSTNRDFSSRTFPLSFGSANDATFSGSVTVSDGFKAFGANAIAAPSGSGSYCATFGKSTNGSAIFAGNITVGSGNSTFAGSVTADSFVGNFKENYRGLQATHTLLDSDYNLHAYRNDTESTVTIPLGLGTERSWNFSSAIFGIYLVAATGVTITIVSNGQSHNTNCEAGRAARLMATDTANEYIFIKI
jgi:hypothetical protein